MKTSARLGPALAAVLAASFTYAAPRAASSIKPANLRCEYRVNPSGIDETEPRLSWELSSSNAAARGLKQQAYRIEAAASAADLKAGKKLLWSTGKVEGDASSQIVYKGDALASRQQIFWRVRVWDQDGTASAWSDVAQWSMGLLQAADWKAKWIGAEEAAGFRSPESPYQKLKTAHWIGGGADSKEPAYFRTSLTLPKERRVRKAYVLMSADQRYEFYVNGKQLIRGRNLRMPDYLEIGGDLKTGANTIAVCAHNGKKPALLGTIVVEFESGTPLQLSTSTEWKATTDAPEGWSDASFDDASWKAAEDRGAYGAQPWGEVGFIEERALAARMLRREFEVKPGLRRATAYIAGLGTSEFYINGKKIGDHVLSPGLTDYDKRIFYLTWDVTSQMQPGPNAAGIFLGNGRFWAPREVVPTGMRSLGYPRALCQIELEYLDGSHETVVSDDQWKLTRDGPIRANNEYDGEVYDARKEMQGWAERGFNDAKWETAQLVAAPTGAMRAQMAEPLRVVETLRPVSVKEVQPGVFVFDMGQNMVGWCRIKAKGLAGTEIRLRHSETVQDDGTLYLDNLRSARVLDSYTLKGASSETYEPRFTYHGFRYVEVRGYPGKPGFDAIEGRVVHDDMRLIADFKSSNDLLNRLHKNIVWGVRGNYRSIPTDCPQRDERQGWLGDRSMVSRSESYLFDIAAFYTKWQHDMEDAQNAQGAIPDVVPTYWVMYHDDVTWPSTFLLAPGVVLEQYGDRRIIARSYPAMKKWIEHMRTFIKDDLMPKDTYGDWCVPPATPKEIHSSDPTRATDGTLIATAYFQYLLRLMSHYADIAGQKQDAAEYEALATRMKAAFDRKFYHQEAANYGNASQTSSLLPLALGITPDNQRAAVVEALVRKIERENQGHIGVGLIGAQWLLRTLSDSGHADLAYEIATQKTYPGWGYMVEQGATTVWELWNGNTADPAMNSGNHVMQIGDLGIWLYAYLGGVRSDPAAPGFEKTIIKPIVPKGLDAVRVSHASPKGKIVSDWKREGDSLTLKVTIPPNGVAQVFVPAAKDAQVTESGKDAAQSTGVKLVRRDADAAVFEVGSGSYEFRSKL